MSSSIASKIDHTLLRADATVEDLRLLVAEAKEHGFHSVCVNPYWLPTVRPMLEGSDVKLCSVVAFPLGASLPQTKAASARFDVSAGADEVDVVMNIGAAREGHWDFIEHEVHEVVSHAEGSLVKIILETCYLSDDEIRHAAERCAKGRAHYVKTSTGFGPAGATVEAVRILRETVGDALGVKASGGIRDRATAEAMLAAGASRLGTSQSVSLVNALA
ncbi:MAG: deoxyribose-phosphate aldolase [Verrucomicrobiota bacterium]